MSRDLAFLEVYSDIGGPRAGANSGVSALSKRSGSSGLNETIKVIQNIEPTKIPNKYAKYIEILHPFFTQKLAREALGFFNKCDEKKQFPVIISGDHSNALGLLGAFIKYHAKNANSKIALIWLDAHADLHSIYTTPSGNLHGMSLGGALWLDNMECKVNSPDPQTLQYWEDLKRISAIKDEGAKDLDDKALVFESRQIRPFFLGLRSFEKPEEYLIKKHNFYAISSTEHRKIGQEALLKLKEELKSFDKIYLSFDVDSLDLSLMPLTGTPVKDGYTKEEIKGIFDVLLNLPNLGAFEITEFNPSLGNNKNSENIIQDIFNYALDLLRKPLS
ncbi:MAG: arginase family protein [Helicobacter sp.]|nr:arginase family protein [Helicobacter sp.]